MKSTQNFVDTYLTEVCEIAKKIDQGNIVNIINLIFNAWQQGHSVYTCGNGGSAAAASHLACDLSKFTWVEGKRRLKAFSLCDNAALISALTNDVGFDRIFVEQLKPSFEKDDILVAISVHGGSSKDQGSTWSQNLVLAAEYVKACEGKLIAFLGFDGGALSKISDASIIVPSTANGLSSTPHVEGFHVVLHHLICQRLLDMMQY